MRVLVTGGAGFIGVRLSRRLAEMGADVVVLDDLSTGDATRLPPSVELVRHDITRPRTSALIGKLRPTHVVHAAAQVKVDRSMADPVQDRMVNLDGTRQVAHGARLAGATRIVFVSSGGAVYGNTSVAREDDPPSPMSYYGVHKLAAEGYVALSGVPYAIARPSNVYGPGQRADLEDGVVAIFCAGVADGVPVTVHGDGGQERDFVHVDDVVSALVAMLQTDRIGTWNVGTGIATSINALLASVERAFGRSAVRTSGDARVGDVRTSSVSIDLIRKDLGWSPTITLDDGLRALVGIEREVASSR